MGNKENKRSSKKGNSPVMTLVTLILVAVFLFSAFKIVTIGYKYYVGQKTYKEVSKIAVKKDTKKDVLDIDFKEIHKINEDVIAWIYAKDTKINYPVLQGDTNDEYLRTMYNREYNISGSIFVDSACEKPFEQFNTIVYGHRMKDKSMFGSFGEFRDADYFKKHQTMYIVTPEKKYKVGLFSVITIKADSPLYNMNFGGDTEKSSYLEQIKGLNEAKCEEADAAAKSVEPTDNIVMLSTCSYEYEDARLVLYGKLEEM